MPSPPTSHPDRACATLANLDAAGAARGSGPFVAPGEGARDCRIDLKLLQWRARQALAASEPARARLAGLPAEQHPDLWAGTVQDGAARGFAVALEEALSLAPPLPDARRPPDPPQACRAFGKDLRRRKDLLVASATAQVRYTRKEGVSFLAHDGATPSANCLRFEARRELGTLDGFVADPAERPRLFSAQFLQPQEFVSAPDFAALRLAGRLGRGPVGWPCELTLWAAATAPGVRLLLRIEHRVPGYRLRARFLGVPDAAIAHDCTDVREVVQNDAGGFVAFTLVRACGTLLVDGEPVAVPAAQCLGTIEHGFRLG